jgi:putative hydrolase of the HAD superfamily
VLEKDPDTYARIVDRLGVPRERFLMIGNSVRSDVLPVLAIGAHAIHVPYHLTWEHELVDDHDEEFVELASIADVPIWLGLAEL